MMSERKKKRMVRIFTIVMVSVLALMLAIGPLLMFFG